jgi:hypothetical protein
MHRFLRRQRAVNHSGDMSVGAVREGCSLTVDMDRNERLLELLEE